MAALLSERGKLVVYTRGAALLLCAFTPFSEILLKPNVVPSDEYIESTWPIYFLVIVGFGMVNFLAMDYSDFAATFSREISHFEYFTSRVALMLTFAVCFQVFLQSSVPSLVLRVSGANTEIEMEISDLNPNRDRKYCIRGVFLRHKPYFADDICNIDPSVLNTLSADDFIVVSGNGNWMGVIPEHVARAR
ncbi:MULTISPECIES: hypothetical protein [Rhodobacter]|uniref:hypothetical protein n=1 Tax=Rhodobacter TaxID=1060 RepID=UPI001115579F|nr:MULTISPECIES: hypothetical protein [Rhodobacter]